MNNLALKIALRYIFSKRKVNFISIITFISIVGITVGIAAIICVTSLFNGFHELSEKQIVGIDAHMKITSLKGEWIENSNELINKIKSNSNIELLTPITERKIIAIANSKIQVFELFAIPFKDLDYLKQIKSSVVAGRFDLDKYNGKYRIVLGINSASKLSILPKDSITLASANMLEQAITGMQFNSGSQVKLAGIYQTNLKDYDFNKIFIEKSAQEELFGVNNDFSSGIAIRLKDIKLLNQTKIEIETLLGSNFKVNDYYDQNRAMFNVMKFERWVAFSILTIIIIIAVFNILASLSLTVFEKKSDISLLKAVGANNSLIKQIFILEGFLIGIFSTVAGSVLGLLLCYGQIYFKWIRFSGDLFIIDHLPISVHFSDVVLIIFITIFLSLVITLYPSKIATDLNIIKGLREE
ncbi:MAG: FtsX-like permease family protein [Candidatus Kapabacteria bacterium]|nr:FtsX-like permease family protein [Candidatus Kapabacteria bacterium]